MKGKRERKSPKEQSDPKKKIHRNRETSPEEELERLEDNLDLEPEEEEEEDSSVIAVTVMGFAIAAVILIIIVLFMSGVLTKRSGSSGKKSSTQTASGMEASSVTGDGRVRVPDVTGKTVSEAQSALTKLHLGLKFGGEQTSNEDEGKIISQNPKAGASVPEHSTVTYVRSSGPEEMDFPDETGNYLADVKAELLNMGFTGINVEQKHSSRPLGTVIETDPAADRPVTTSDKVVLTVSIGEKSRTAYAGDYLGLTASNAAAEAAKEGIVCDVAYGESDFVKTGQVMSQDIEPGSQVASGTVLTLTVNEKEPDSGELEESSDKTKTKSSAAAGTSEKEKAASDTVTLRGPENYKGGRATFVLVQKKDGKEYQIVEKRADTVSFPVRISLKKVIGVSQGTLWLYEGTGDDMARRASWPIS